MVIGSGVCVGVKSLIAGVLLSHAFSGELKAVSVVNETIQDGVAECWVADNVVPMFNGDLAGGRWWRRDRGGHRGSPEGRVVRADLELTDPNHRGSGVEPGRWF